MVRALPAAWAVFLTGLLAAAGLLGFAVARGAVDPGLHGMASVAVSALAIGSHVRRGGGWDFLAVMLLLAAMGLGTVAEAESPTATGHLVTAIAAVLFSAALHLGRGIAALLPPAGETWE